MTTGHLSRWTTALMDGADPGSRTSIELTPNFGRRSTNDGGGSAMAGFRSLARQVRDPRSDLALRRYSLRKCLERFAPYGHRATWDHLCARHGIEPEDRAPDPARLTRALEELETARAVWLHYEAGFAERRRMGEARRTAPLGAFDDRHRRTWAERRRAVRRPGRPPRGAARGGTGAADFRPGVGAGQRLPGLRAGPDRLAAGPGQRAVVRSGLHRLRNRGAAARTHPGGAGEGPADPAVRPGIGRLRT